MYHQSSVSLHPHISTLTRRLQDHLGSTWRVSKPLRRNPADFSTARLEGRRPISFCFYSQDWNLEVVESMSSVSVFFWFSFAGDLELYISDSKMLGVEMVQKNTGLMPRRVWCCKSRPPFFLSMLRERVVRGQTTT